MRARAYAGCSTPPPGAHGSQVTSGRAPRDAVTGDPPARELSVAAEPDALERVHALVHGLWQDARDVSADDRTSFEIAVAEVAADVVEHAAAGRRSEMRVRVVAYPDRVEAFFTDTGDEARVDLDSVSMPDGLAEDGRGLALARAAADELRSERDGAVNRWQVTRRRRR